VNRPPRADPPELLEPIATPAFPELLVREIAALPEERRLARSGAFEVLLAEAREIPLVLHEIGRLRETSFRAAGEGTGRAVDLDAFDTTYVHLFLWNAAAREVAGAYRLGRCDELLARAGTAGLYTSSLFHYRPEMLAYLSPALELGRSFVRLEYQKSYSALLLLWKGIGEFLVRNPHHRRLLGAVSISDVYSPRARALIVGALRRHRRLLPWSACVRPRRPPRLAEMESPVAAADADPDVLDARVREIEGGARGLPVLLRQYLKLGARLLGFNVDPAFANALDGLLVIDLAEVEPRPLERYFGRDGLARFLAGQAPPGAERRIA
jgi:putative hemolysin